MSADRPTRAGGRRGAEAVQTTQDGSTAQGEGRSPERVAELLELAGREPQVIRQITNCLEQLTQTQAAKRELCELTSAEVQDAVEYRRSISVRGGVSA